MIRLLLHLLKIKDYEPCKSCETLKTQLEFERAEKKELTETLLNLVKPQPVIQSIEPKVLKPGEQVGLTFSRRRGILEEANRRAREVKSHSPFVAKPDSEKSEPPKHITEESIEAIENKLGLNEEVKENAS